MAILIVSWLRRARFRRMRGEKPARAEAQAQAEAMAPCVAADPVHKGMALLQKMKAGQLQQRL